MRITENLTALEIDTLKEIREHWTPAQDYFSDFLAYLGMENAVAEEVALLPGMDELFLLTRILREVESDRYDVVIVDCSPTADALRIFTFTDTACTKANKLIEAERKILKLVRPFIKHIKGARAIIPKDEVYLLFEDMLGNVGRLGSILKNPDVASVRLVLNPDRVAIAETRRAFTYIGLFGLPIDGIFVNKVLPIELSKGYLRDWFTLQQKLLDSIERSFLDVTKFRAHLLDREPIGLELLSAMARRVFDQKHPADILSLPKSVSIAGEDGKYRLTFRLPSVDKEQLDVGRKDSELILTAGDYTRVYSLPDNLTDRDIVTANFTDGTLVIIFE